MTARAIFFGAGLSVPSGLPSANALVSAVLDALGCDANDIRQFLEARVPFELMIQTLRERTDIAPLLGIYATGQPSAYHLAMATLAKRGLVTTFVTTNFDTLLEQAFSSAGLIERRDYLIYRDTRSFRQIRWGSARILIIKIHGSVENLEELAATLERVASRRAIDAARHVLAPLLSGARCRQLYIAGYSCSDAFDIVPVMNATSSACRVILVEHEARRAGAPRWSVPRNITLEGAMLLRARTDAILRYFRPFLALPNQDQRQVASSWSAATEAVARWIEGIPPAEREVRRLYSLSRLFIHAHWFQRAEAMLLEALEAAKALGNPRWIAEVHLNLGICNYRLGNHRKAAVAAVTAIRSARSAGYDRVEGNAVGNLGNVFYSTGRLRWGRVCQDEAIRIAKRLGYKQLEINSYGNIGIILDQSRRYGEAIRYHKKALHGARGLGDPIGVARHLGNIAMCLNRLERFADARPYAEAAIARAIETAQPAVQAEALGELYRLERGSDLASALAHLFEAIRITQAIGDRDKLTRFQSWLEEQPR